MNMFQVPKLTSQPQNRPVQQAQQPPLNRTVGNNKTCNWVFENGEVCTHDEKFNLLKASLFMNVFWWRHDCTILGVFLFHQCLNLISEKRKQFQQMDGSKSISIQKYA